MLFPAASGEPAASISIHAPRLPHRTCCCRASPLTNGKMLCRPKRAAQARAGFASMLSATCWPLHRSLRGSCCPFELSYRHTAEAEAGCAASVCRELTLLVAALRVAIMRPIAQEYKDLASMLAAKMRSTRAALFGSPETSAPRVAVAPSAQTSPPYLGPCYPRPSSACDLNLQLRHLQEARRALRPHSSHAARGRHSRACPVNR